MKKIVYDLLNRETVGITILLCTLLAVFFSNVVFFNSTFLTSNLGFLPTTLPNGPYGYAGHRVSSSPTRDPGASAWHVEPLARTAERMVKSGQLPLWNPCLGAGSPLAANMQSGALYPLTAIAYLLPDSSWVVANDFLTLVQFFIAGYFTFLFLRLVGAGVLGASGSAIAFMFCGRLVLFIGSANFRVDCLIPLLLYSTARLYAKRGIASVLFLGISTCLSIVAGMPESTFFALLLAGAYYLFRVFTSWELACSAIIQLADRLVPFIAAMLLGLALSAHLVFPFVEYVGVSWNAHPAGAGLFHFRSSEAISILVPYFLGDVFSGWTLTHLMDTMPYVGVVATLLATVSIKRGTRLTKSAYFFGGFSFFFLLKAYGAPIVQWVGYLPLFDISGFPYFASAAFMFSVAVLAGIGLDHVQHSRVSYRLVLWSTALVLAVVLGFTADYMRFAIEKNNVDYLVFQVALTLVFLVCFYLVILLLKRGIIKESVATFGLLGLLIAELFVALPKQRADRYDPFTQPPFITSLLQVREPFRVLGLDSVLYPTTAAVFGIEDIRNLDALYPRRYFNFIKTLVAPGVLSMFTGTETIHPTKYLDLMNVRYILSIDPLTEEWQSPLSRAEPIYEGEVKIYENPSAYPRAFVVHQAVRAESEADALAKLASPSFDPRSQAVIEGSIPEQVLGALSDAPSNDFSSAKLIRRDLDSVTIQVSIERPGFLVLADTFYPGWKARIDGEAATMYAADYLFRAVYLEGGGHQVEFSYDPLSFKMGLLISSTAVVVVVMVFLYCLLRRGNPKI